MKICKYLKEKYVENGRIGVKRCFENQFSSVHAFETICTWKICGKEKNILKDTFLGNTKIGIEKTFRIVDLLYQNVKLKTIARIENISEKHLKTLVKKFRKFVQENY